MRAEEEFCRNCFDSYLRERLGLLTAWQPGTEPPDYFLTVGGATFAVEVTQLFGEVRTEAGTSMGNEKYEASMESLCETIRKAAIEEGVLRGFYLVQFVGPFAEFRRSRNLIVSGVLEYIRGTQGATTARGRVVFAEIGEQMKERGFTPEMIAEFVGYRWIPGSCSAVKLGGTPRGIHCVTSGRSRVMWEGQALAEACRMLQQAVSEKRRKLADIADARILLLLHQWPMTGAGIYEQCRGALRDLECFHSVFVVEGEGGGYFLHTQETEWWKPGTGNLGSDAVV